ncbi:carboxylesterase [Geoalkalibacter ferrihydriticus]|uniref:Carboxylesterase n=1 Tax=Geoalkalibacter ferrihydriticus TaxID=392333 RepID=A0A1G9IKD0_9BACT|nr:alpha/beta fold hydrolase [Geoalkalibacter ferrihydriticus]SDL25677.1 carboxylesterase [Geoalkalibacter ferrihydriticus]
MQSLIESEIARARADGCTRQENLPFVLGDGAARNAVLLVHGFSGSPWEMRPLGTYLAGRGFLVYGLRLPGHGTTPEDLAGKTMEEWLETVAAGLRRLFATGTSVSGVGQSTGALLLLLAALEQAPAGMVLLSPFLQVRHRLAPAAGILRFFKTYQNTSVTPQNLPFYYDRRPVEGMHQINRITRCLRRRLKQIKSPTLIVSAQGDRTILVPSAMRLYQELGSAHKEYHLFGPEAPHVLTTPDNPRQGETLTLTASFLAGLYRQQTSSIF